MVNTLSAAQMRTARQARDPRFDGKFFVAVLSTGIFCRPICPARMAKEENVRYHNSAVSAIEAGYRPCKLCRPDSAPRSYDWIGTDATLNHAVKLMHASPELTVANLAARLQVSERYLHKLFTQKLGVSPSAFRLSGQLMFAKQLLQQSKLRVTDVAIAAGFNTTRALQSAMKKTFSMSPTDLRKQQSEHQSLMPTQLFLSYRPPYLWQPMRTFLASRCIEGIESVCDNKYERILDCDGVPGKVTAMHVPEKNGFSVDIDVPDTRMIKPILNNLTRVLDCHADWLTIEETLQAAGATVTDSVRGIRLPGTWTPFEAGCRAIFGQQVSVAAAINRTRLLVELVRKNKDIIGFPTAHDVTEDIVAQIGMPSARKQTLVRYAQAMQDPTISGSVADGDLTSLLSLKGIGPWTCQYLALRGLGDPDVWLEKDLAIIRQCQRFKIDAEAAKPWRSYLTLVLWHDYTETSKT